MINSPTSCLQISIAGKFLFKHIPLGMKQTTKLNQTKTKQKLPKIEEVGLDWVVFKLLCDLSDYATSYL